MGDYGFRIASADDRGRIVSFMRRHWDTRHPLVELPDFFDYYYRGEQGRLNFALCEQAGRLAALAGFVPANRLLRPDVWVSIWVADAAMRGSGLELMAALPRLAGCRTLACNNIRPETRPFYEFLGYQTGRVGHFYRLADKPAYALAQGIHQDIPPAGGDARLVLVPDAAALTACGFEPPPANPQKDLWYIGRRFFSFPRQRYRVYGAYLPGDTVPFALLATRLAEADGTRALRVVDYIGPAGLLPQLGGAIDGLMRRCGAEYTDWYCVGIAPDTMRAAGFAERAEGDLNVIPNYLDPPLIQNTDYYYFTSDAEGFTLFKADGDQDRPNIPLGQIADEWA